MRTRGFTLTELIVGMMIMGLLIIGAMTVFAASMKNFYVTTTDHDLTTENSLGMQRVAGTLRGAYSMQILNNGTKVQYTMPKLAAGIDPVTLEQELLDPLESDGVQRSFSIVNGELIDDTDGRVLVENVILIDPHPDSSQYNQVYAPFQLTTIGSRRALTINFITADTVLDRMLYTRMKTTVIIRNSL
ncbi:MAG: prepilin-type N-terminal cleavage/methylation domain-containing protein [Armatimonadetes bacterium]|nr:prepilin-type N-terminal cleavage/methylation domain-containing protein [Armatimonadota bacterium]